MTNEIGTAAGKVWKYLHQNGESSMAKIARDTGLPNALAHRAIGWLAREGKLHIDKDNRAEMIRLH